MAKKKKEDLVTVGKNNALIFSNDFNNILQTIKDTTDRTSKLVTTQNLEQASDNLSLDQVQNIIDDLQDAQSVARDIEKGRRQIRKYFDVRRDLVVKQFDEKVEAAGYSKLNEYHKDAKQLKRILREKRKAKRLDTIVKPMFEQLAKSYQTIEKLAPKLASGDNFVLNNPSIVGGGKKEPDKSELRTIMAQYLTDLERNLNDLQVNNFNFDNATRNAIFAAYSANPTNENYQKLIAQAITNQQAAQNNQQQTPQVMQPVDDVNKIYSWLVNYITLNLRAYQNVRVDYQQKLTLIDDLLNQFKTKQSYLNQTLLNDAVDVYFVMCTLIYDVFTIQ